MVTLSAALRKQDPARALEMAERAVKAGDMDNPATLTSLARAHLNNHNRPAAQKIVDGLEHLAKQVYVPPPFIALIHAEMGDLTKAFAWLERGMDEHSGAAIMTELRTAQWLEVLGNEARYWSLIERMNFPALPIEHPFYGKEQQMRFGKGLATRALPKSPRLEMTLAEGVRIPRGVGPAIAVSPDGETVVYVGESAAGRQLYQRHINQYLNTPILGTEDALDPRFSPQGDRIVYFDPDFRGFRKIPLSGGISLPVCEDCDTPFWADDGFIYFSRDKGGTVWRVSEQGGGTEEPVFETASDPELPAVANFRVLPGGQALLFETGLTGELEGGIAVVDMESKRVVEISANGSSPIFSPSGHILFARVDKLIAVPFDVEGLQMTGGEKTVLHGVRVENGGALQAAVSPSGGLFYAPAAGDIGTQLVWVDRQGLAKEAYPEPHFFNGPRISPGGRRVVVQVNEGSTNRIRILDLEAGILSSLRSPVDASNPIWSADGKKVAFTVAAPGKYVIQWKSVDGSGEVETLIESSLRIYPETFSREGDLLVFREHSPAPTLFVHTVNVKGSRTPILAPGESGHSSALSRDGNWLAYVSDALSDRSEVFVRPFPGPGGPVQMSRAGGGFPAWRPDGKELFFLTGTQVPGDMMVVSIEREGPSQIKSLGVKPLFDAKDFWVLWHRTQYAVDPNGHRFLMLKQSSNESSPRINVILDWSEELKRLAPTRE